MHVDDVVAAAIQFGRGASGDAVIAWKGDVAYCLSYDRTVLLRATNVSPVRDDAVVFRACDYEGPDCRLHGKWVEFTLQDNTKVSVPRPLQSFKGLSTLFKTFENESSQADCKLILARTILADFDADLPHVEFHFKPTATHLIQRDIYTGKVLDISRESVCKEAEPLAMRTQDFMALFGLAASLTFAQNKDFFLVTSMSSELTAVVGGCIYDAVGRLNILQE
jgi:hypothetical protein